MHIHVQKGTQSCFILEVEETVHEVKVLARAERGDVELVGVVLEILELGKNKQIKIRTP